MKITKNKSKKSFIINIICLIVFIVFLYHLYFPKYILFALFLISSFGILLYADNIRQKKIKIENESLDKRLITQWLLKDAIAFTVFSLYAIIIENIVVKHSPQNIPAIHSFIGMLIAYILFAIFKWFRLLEDYIARRRDEKMNH